MSSKPPVSYLSPVTNENAVHVTAPGFLKKVFQRIQGGIKSLLEEERYTISTHIIDGYIGYPMFAGGYLKPGVTVLAAYTEKDVVLNPFAKAGETVTFLSDVGEDGVSVKLQHTGLKGNGVILNLKKRSPDQYEIVDYFYSRDLTSCGRHAINEKTLSRFFGSIVPAVNAMHEDARKAVSEPSINPSSHLRLV